MAAFCSKIAELNAAPSPFATVGEGDVQGAKDAIADYQQLVDEVSAVAPAEIETDVRAVQASFQDLADTLAGAKTPRQLVLAARRFQRQAAGIAPTVQRLEEYTDANCEES